MIIPTYLGRSSTPIGSLWDFSRQPSFGDLAPLELRMNQPQTLNQKNNQQFFQNNALTSKPKKKQNTENKNQGGIFQKKKIRQGSMEVALNLLPADPGATRVPPSGLRLVSGRGTRRGDAGRGTMATRKPGGSPTGSALKARPKTSEMWDIQAVKSGEVWGDLFWLWSTKQCPQKNSKNDNLKMYFLLKMVILHWGFGNKNSRVKPYLYHKIDAKTAQKTPTTPLLSDYMILEP